MLVQYILYKNITCKSSGGLSVISKRETYFSHIKYDIVICCLDHPMLLANNQCGITSKYTDRIPKETPLCLVPAAAWLPLLFEIEHPHPKQLLHLCLHNWKENPPLSVTIFITTTWSGHMLCWPHTACASHFSFSQLHPGRIPDQKEKSKL